MSRTYPIGFIAALAALVLSAPAPAAAPLPGPHGNWATFPSSFFGKVISTDGRCSGRGQAFILTSIGASSLRSHTKPAADGLLLDVYGGGKLAGFACADGVAKKALAGGGPLRFDRGYLSVGLRAKPGSTVVLWDPSCASGCTFRGQMPPSSAGIVWWPDPGLYLSRSCIESVSVKYTMFLETGVIRPDADGCTEGLVRVPRAQSAWAFTALGE